MSRLPPRQEPAAPDRAGGRGIPLSDAGDAARVWACVPEHERRGSNSRAGDPLFIAILLDILSRAKVGDGGSREHELSEFASALASVLQNRGHQTEGRGRKHDPDKKVRVERHYLEMRPRSVQHGGNNASLPALAVDHLGLPCDYGGQDFLLFALRHVEVVQCFGNLCSNLVELFGRDVEVFMRFVHVLAGVLKGSAGRLAEPERPHEFKAWQLARLIPFLQGRVHIEFRILDDFVAEAVNDHADGVDAPDPFVKTLLCHRYSLLNSEKKAST